MSLRFRFGLTSKTLVGTSLCLAILLAALLFSLQIFFPKEEAKADLDASNTDNVWEGTLGPAAVGTANSDVDLVSNVTITQNTTTGVYQAGLTAGQTTGYIRSKVIDRSPSGPLKTWKELQLGISRPVGTTTSFTVDILCGSSSEGCIINQVLLSNVPLTNDEYTLPASLNSKTKLKVQINFSRPDTTNPLTTLYNWQVQWEVDTGVSLLVSKSSGNPLPNTANPELINGTYPGVNNNNQVNYTASYSLNRSVQNLQIEIPFPTGSYIPTVGSTKNYTVSYIGSSGGNTCVNSGGSTVSCYGGGVTKTIFNLGNKATSTVGSVSVTFKINSGPPNGVIFKTKPAIFGDDLTKQTLPDDVLNIESRAFAGAALIAPEFIAAPSASPSHNGNFHFVLRMATGGVLFQSDMFNANYVLDYSGSTCFSNTVSPVNFGTGTTSVNINTAGRKVTYNLPSPITLPTPSLTYGVRIQANPTCGVPTGIPATLTISSEQDSSFITQKITNAQYAGPPSLPKYQTPPATSFDMIVNGPAGLVGVGQLLWYNLRFGQRTSYPTSDFWALHRIPSNATFVAANLALGELATLGAIPNNWKIYYSTASAASPPSRSSGTWVELKNGTPSSGSIPPCQGPYGCNANPAPGLKINWIKWDLGGNPLNWDRLGNWDEVMGQVAIVSDNNASGSIVSNSYAYSGSICISSFCPVVHTVSVDNKPYFNVLQTPCTTEIPPNTSDNYFGCASFPSPSITAPSGGSYYSKSHVWNGHESGPISRGDATNVTVSIRLPDRQFLDPTTPIDLSANDGPHARCNSSGNPNSTNCPNSSDTFQNPASWLNPSAVRCSAAFGPTCSVEWVIPKIYSSQKFPFTYPDTYYFYVRLNIKAGLIDQTTLCNGNCNVNITTSTPAFQNTNLPKASPFEVVAGSSPGLTIQKQLAPGYSSPISYQTGTRFRLNYNNLPPSTGAVSSVTIIDRLPINIDLQPAARLNLDPAFLPNNAAAMPSPNAFGQNLNYTAYYMTQNANFPRTLDSPPPKNDPNWTQFTAGFNNALIPLIDWVKWERNSIFEPDGSGVDGRDYVELGLVDTGSPDDTVFTNKSFLIWTTGAGEQSAEATAQVRVETPGFVRTTLGNVGSRGDLGSSINLSGTCSTVTNCHTTYLGIQGQSFENNFFTSFKNWLVPAYSFAADNGGLKTNYAQMYKDYGKEATSCNTEDLDSPPETNNGCLTGSEPVQKYTVSSGNTLKINRTTNYLGVPKIIFVDGGGSGTNDALEINVDLRTVATTGLIFVVNGNVKVAYGVANLDGVYLVEGQFSTGRRTQTVNNGQAGQFATIIIGRDGFARIAYVSGDNVRFIKCLDLNCTGKDYGYVTTVTGSDVVSVGMSLYETPFEGAGANIDYPKIVIGMRNSSGATTKFISCYDKEVQVGVRSSYKEGETCLDNDTVVYPDANDPDIIVAGDGIPGYIFGVGPNGDKALNIANCRLYFPEPPVNDRNCPNPILTTIDGGSGVHKGNETNYTVDNTTGIFGSLVATYVDRSAGRSDLWFAKMRYDNLGTGCSGTTFWDCQRLVGSAGSPGNVGAYHSSHTAPNGLTYIYYQDSATDEIKYIQCSNKPCTAFQTRVIDCTASCDGQTYVAASKVFINYIAYTVTEGGNDIVKMAYCGAPGNCITTPWPIVNISNTVGPGGYVTTDAKIYTQGIAGGRGVENNIPRLVFFDHQAGNNFLVYVRCTDFGCSQATRVYSFIDDGTAVSLPDKQLNFNGSVIAYGAGIGGTDTAINLQRDLFGEGTSKPGEIFTFQPKYYYLFRHIIKEPQKISETPP